MKIGIIGLPQSGKKTVFRLLTGVDLAAHDPESLKAPFHGIAAVKDIRFEKLIELYNPRKKTPAHIEIVLMPKIDKEYIRAGHMTEHLKDADALCHVVRDFADDSIYHAEGSVSAARDIDSVNAELILSDLMFVEKRLQKLEQDMKRKHDDKDAAERGMLLIFKEHLEKECPLRTLDLDVEKKRSAAAYPLLTLKPMVVVVNVGENMPAKNVLPDDFLKKYGRQNVYFIQISAKIEDEMSRLDAKDRQAFIEGLGLKEIAGDRLAMVLYEALGLISFFTTANNELRAWTIGKNSTAPKAAGMIHSDMERGFIRAEVMRYADLEHYGSEARVKEAGRLMIKGKDYIVCDGDILNIRFNV